MAIHGHLAALLLLATFPLAAQTTSAPVQTLIGQGWGVDHVGVGVNDMAQAQHDYEQLGFKITGRKTLSPGLIDSHMYLQNNSYLELLWASESTAIKLGLSANRQDGGVFLGINVSSANASAEYLTARGFDVTRPRPGSSMEEGQTTLPPPQWYTVGTNDTPTAGKKGIKLPIFLIEYVGDQMERHEKHRAAGDLDHPNTAMGIHAVWFAVRSVEAQLGTLRDAGLEAGEARRVKFLGAHGREVKAGQGVILLLEPSAKDGPLATFLSNPIDPKKIIGLSIEVSDLGTARRVTESGTGRKLETYKGFYGTSFVLPPEVTHGVWMEMYQAADHSHGNQY